MNYGLPVTEDQDVRKDEYQGNNRGCAAALVTGAVCWLLLASYALSCMNNPEPVKVWDAHRGRYTMTPVAAPTVKETHR